MFSRKFNINGKAIQKVLPVALPLDVKTTSERNEAPVNISCLDFMGIEEFLTAIEQKSDCNNKLVRNASCDLASQLKESRALLSLASYLSSNYCASNILDRLMDTAYFILNAENVYLLQLDPTSSELVITHTRVEDAVGTKIPVQELSAG